MKPVIAFTVALALAAHAALAADRQAAQAETAAQVTACLLDGLPLVREIFIAETSQMSSGIRTDLRTRFESLLAQVTSASKLIGEAAAVDPDAAMATMPDMSESDILAMLALGKLQTRCVDLAR